MKLPMLVTQFEREVIQAVRDQAGDAGYDVASDWRQVAVVGNYALRGEGKQTATDEYTQMWKYHTLGNTLVERGIPQSIEQQLDIQCVKMMERRSRKMRVRMDAAFRKDMMDAKDEAAQAEFDAMPEVSKG